jgi:hypothetical protein
VEVGPLLLGRAAVGGVPDQGVAKAEPLAERSARCDADEEAAPDERVDVPARVCGEGRVHELGQDTDLELPADHRRPCEQRPLPGSQAVEPGCEQGP